MKIYLTSTAEKVQYTAKNTRGHSVSMEGHRNIGGSDASPSPTELLLMSLAGCTAVCMDTILRKMRQPLLSLEMEIEGRRYDGESNGLFTDIHIHCKLYGDVDPEKAEKAMRMTIDNYCTVSRMLHPNIKKSSHLEIIH